MSVHLKYTLLGLFLTIFLAGLFAGLGRWQLSRADEKTDMLETRSLRAAEPAAALPARLDDPVRWRHRKVHTTATPVPARQFLLDNRIHEGRAGFNVLTVFRPASGGLLLVDRGWVPLGASRSDLPDVSLPEQPMQLEGTIHVPYGEPFSLGGMDDGELGWPRIIQFLDFNALGQRLGEPLRPYTLRLDPASKHGYLREWRITAISPNKHLAYAFQWFALAATVVVVFLVLALRRRRQ